MSDTDLLAEIEAAIDAAAPPAELLVRLTALAHLADAEGELTVRYLVARGILENRNELPQSALATFQRARDRALRDKVVTQLARISREVARVHAWSGDIAGASMELLRSVAEIEQSNASLGRERAASGGAEGSRPTRDDVARRGRQEVQIRADRAATVAEIGRLDIEAGRYEAALAALDEAARQAPTALPPREAGRIAYNRCESWFGLGDIDRCLALIEETAPLFSKTYSRELFRVRLLKARCLLHKGDRELAAAVAREAEEAIRGSDSYERGAEWQLFDGLMKEKDDPQAAVSALRAARLRFADDNLPRHEVEAGIHLARILVATGRMPEAQATITEALARASGLPALVDQVRFAAYSFWPEDKRPLLSGDRAVGASAAGQGNRFLVLTTLGRGGFGTVERAIDMATGEQVAIKRLRPDRGRTTSAWNLIDGTVRREIETAAKVPPRFAARTRYVNIDDRDDLVLVQDFVDGPTLRQVIKDGAADLAKRLVYAAHLTRCVAALHQNEIAHRDLKPDNVILRNGNEPVLIDLGLAALMGTSDIFSGMGTPGYAPPEQWKAGTAPKIFGSEDIYALGRIIVELGGSPPPDNRISTRLRRRFSRSPRGDAGDTLRQMVERMTDNDPARRMVDLGEVAGALDEAAARARPTPSS